MKSIRILNNSFGQFNLGSSEKTHIFNMAIFEDNKIVELDGVKCILYFSSEEQLEHIISDPYEYMNEIFEKSFRYPESLLFSSTDHKSQYTAFVHVYCEFYKEINEELAKKKHAEAEREIERCQAILEETTFAELPCNIPTHYLKGRVDLYSKWVNSEKEKQADFIPESKSYEESKVKIDRYQGMLDKVQKVVDLIENYDEEV